MKFFSAQDTLKFQYESDDTTFVCPFNKEVELPGIGLATVMIRPRTFERYVSEKSHEVRVVALNQELATSAYLGGLAADLAQKESATLQLTYTASSARKAADILNMVIDEYNRRTISTA